MNNMSVDCDCDGSPATPRLKDIGILASTDPVALDQACLDLVFNHTDASGDDSKPLQERINRQHGTHITEYAEAIGLGTRKYNIKTVVGPDDYASMQEVVRRRYGRMIDEGTPLPDLIITDGGKGQMEVVREVVEDELHLSIPIAGLAKDDRHRTRGLYYNNVEIPIPTDSEGFRLYIKEGASPSP